MIPTKTYPLSAIMGGEISDKERIAELADAFNRVCDENADFVAQSVTDENRIAELEAQLAAVTAERDGMRSALPKRREWNQAGGRDDYLYTEGWNDAIDARRIEEGK